MDIVPLASTFGLIAVAELGDKTQLAAIALSATYRARSVFVGAILAVVLVDGLSILVGAALGDLIPMRIVGLIGAIIFMGFGIFTLLSKEDRIVKAKRGKFAILTSFLMISVMELGDKTQFSIIALAAKYGAPVLVFIGMLLAYVLLMGIGVAVGNKLLRYLPPKYLKILTAGLFILFGVLFLLSAAGVNIL